MQFRTLRLFCSVVHHRSFSRAALAHGVTQSAVSQAVQHLEEQLGTTLIDRRKRPLEVTRAGVIYYEGVRRLVHDYDSVEQEVRSLGKHLGGRVTVAAIYSVGLSYMPEAIAEFSQLHGGYEVRTEYASPTRVVELVRQAAVDFGLVSYPQGSRSLRSVVWQREPMRVIAAIDHPWAERREIALADLQGRPLIGFEPGLRIRREIDQYLGRRGIHPAVSMEFDNIDSLIRAIQANRGMGILPEAAVRREIRAGSLCVLPCPELELVRPLGIIWRRSGRLSPAARELAALLLGRPLEAERVSADGRRGSQSRPSAIASAAR